MTIRAIKLYLSSVFVYIFGYLLLYLIPFYRNFLSEQSLNMFFYFLLSFIILSPIYYFLSTNRYSTNKPYTFLLSLVKVFRKEKLDFKDKTAARFLLVKIFFLPLMLQFFINNYNWFLQNLKSASFFAIMITLIFTIDTFVFFFGYSFEFKFLKNRVKSVEPTFFGWFVAIICYPPFNGVVGNYFLWGANDYAYFWSDGVTMAFRVIIIFLLLVYLSATFALGPKASNLTNRGIVTKFPYSVVRHPAYISKNLMWWITLLPVINFKFAMGMGVWLMIYFFRAYTEERHLSSDNDYIEYKKKVKWKFIPFVY
jgi:protein-S-isoprenylcysteine O-methyltransferase Ste14